MDTKTKIYAVTGNPVIHSRSPDIFNNIFEKKKIDATYIRLAAEDSGQVIEMIKSLGIHGLNVTSPFKESIVKFLDIVHDEAEILGCVNTIVNIEGKLHGYNTDCYGVTQSFEDSGIEIKGKQCIVIGAGGAAKAAAYGMHKNGANVIFINRTDSKAEEAAKITGCNSEKFVELEDQIKKADIIISALTQNVNPVKKEWINSSQVIFDANYKGSLLNIIAKEKGCTIISAENWLLNQAARSYEIFFNEKPDTELLKEGLSKAGLSERKNIISLVGLMGSGKSCIGKLLAEKLKYEFIDIDKEIESKKQMTISEIFEKYGEKTFREFEKEELGKSFNTESPKILSCGGGIILDEENRKVLKEKTIVIWLYASPKVIYERVNVRNRPLLQTEDALSKLSELFNSRKSLYAKSAHIVFSTEEKIKQLNTDEIFKELESI